LIIYSGDSIFGIIIIDGFLRVTNLSPVDDSLNDRLLLFLFRLSETYYIECFDLLKELLMCSLLLLDYYRMLFVTLVFFLNTSGLYSPFVVDELWFFGVCKF